MKYKILLTTSLISLSLSSYVGSYALESNENNQLIIRPSQSLNVPGVKVIEPSASNVTVSGIPKSKIDLSLSLPSANTAKSTSTKSTVYKKLSFIQKKTPLATKYRKISSKLASSDNLKNIWKTSKTSKPTFKTSQRQKANSKAFKDIFGVIIPTNNKVKYYAPKGNIKEKSLDAYFQEKSGSPFTSKQILDTQGTNSYNTREIRQEIKDLIRDDQGLFTYLREALQDIEINYMREAIQYIESESKYSNYSINLDRNFNQASMAMEDLYQYFHNNTDTSWGENSVSWSTHEISRYLPEIIRSLKDIRISSEHKADYLPKLNFMIAIAQGFDSFARDPKNINYDYNENNGTTNIFKKILASL